MHSDPCSPAQQDDAGQLEAAVQQHAGKANPRDCHQGPLGGCRRAEIPLKRGETLFLACTVSLARPTPKQTPGSWKELYSNTPATQFREIAIKGLWAGADVPRSLSKEVWGLLTASRPAGLCAARKTLPWSGASQHLACSYQQPCNEPEECAALLFLLQAEMKVAATLTLRLGCSTLRATTQRASPCGSATTSTTRRTPSTSSS